MLVISYLTLWAALLLQFNLTLTLWAALLLQFDGFVACDPRACDPVTLSHPKGAGAGGTRVSIPAFPTTVRISSVWVQTHHLTNF